MLAVVGRSAYTCVRVVLVVRLKGRRINHEMVGKLKCGGRGGRKLGGVGTASLDCERLSLPLYFPLAPIGVLSSPSTPVETQTAREREKVQAASLQSIKEGGGVVGVRVGGRFYREAGASS